MVLHDLGEFFRIIDAQPFDQESRGLQDLAPADGLEEASEEPLSSLDRLLRILLLLRRQRRYNDIRELLDKNLPQEIEVRVFPLDFKAHGLRPDGVDQVA